MNTNLSPERSAARMGIGIWTTEIIPAEIQPPARSVAGASGINKAREIASLQDPIPVGILYRNPAAPCYEDLRHAGQQRSPEGIRVGFEHELDKFTVWPEAKAARDATP